MNNKQLTVIAIAGHGRSGSTLLGQILGEISGFLFTGELGFIWQNGMVNNELCGCGKPFRSCEFWNAVIEELSLKPYDIDAIIKLWRHIVRRRNILQLANPSIGTTRFRNLLNEYTEILNHLYHSVQKVSGASVLIDSCGFPPHVFVLAQIKNIDVKIIHLIRDSRAVAYSWLRKKKNPAVQQKEAYMERLNIIRSSMLWGFDNFSTELFRKRVSKYVALRYEDFARNPKDMLIWLLKRMELEVTSLNFFVDDHTVYLHTTHAVAGNPIRFKKGKIEIRLDEEWKQRMPAHKRIAVTALTWPLLLRYGIKRGNECEK